MSSMLRKIQRVGKRATKFQYSAIYQSVVIECLRDKWRPTSICVSWTRKGRRLITKERPWQPSPDNKMRGVVIWPDPENMEITVTLYKGPKDKSYETKEWDFAIIDVDQSGKRKVLATTSINMVRYASSMPFETDLTLRLKPVSRKIKSVILQVSLSSMFLKEGKATDDDMMSIASMMSVSNLSTIGFLEDEDDETYYWTGGRSVSPPTLPEHILSTDQLLIWARDVTKDKVAVKITNMTTSWRNGMGFLAIFQYYRPDLVSDFDMLSPTSIKENNRQAFELARSLGVACPLTPNMMVTTTVPDKLAVTSFVYQLHQYFTKATQSAVAKCGNDFAESPSDPERTQSPFDISQIPKMFSGKLSPVTTPPPSADKVLNLYSRHSRTNSLTDTTQFSNSRKVSTENGGLQNPLNSECQDRSLSPASAAKLHLDLLVCENVPTSDQKEEQRNETAHVVGTTQIGLEEAPCGLCKEDRSVEYENPCETESSEPLTTESNSSYFIADEDERSRYPDLPPDPSPLSKANASPKQGPASGHGRKLPSPPVDADSEEQIAKRVERRRIAQEMLKKHRIKLNASADQIVASNSLSTESKYQQQAHEMLVEAFNTPRGTRKSSHPPSMDELNSEPSTSSLSITDNSVKPHHSTGSTELESPSQTKPPQSSVTSKPDQTTEKPKHTINSGKVSDENLSSSSSTVKNFKPMDRRNSDSTLQGKKPEPSIRNKRLLTNPGRPNSATTSKRRQLPTVRPLSAQPSQDMVRLQEQKKREEEKKSMIMADAVASQEQTDSTMKVDAEVTSSKDKSQDEQGDVPIKSAQTPTQDKVTPVHKKSLPSPAWSQQNDDLSQDLLVTQSEYVRTELLALREILVGLEEKAGNMEVRVREAMNDGDKEKEEELMQEWFGLLNKKNELIKRQVELNMIEKEEDLEKKQFFINRELRPLMEIPDNEKTKEQKERAGQLLGQLLELIDERDKLERRKLSAEKSSHHERSGLATAQASTTEMANTGYNSQQNSKDCVIS